MYWHSIGHDFLVYCTFYGDMIPLFAAIRCIPFWYGDLMARAFVSYIVFLSDMSETLVIYGLLKLFRARVFAVLQLSWGYNPFLCYYLGQRFLLRRQYVRTLCHIYSVLV